MPTSKEVEPNNIRLSATVGSRPDPDPTLRTMELVDKAVLHLESKFEIRINGIEKAILVQHEDMVRVPTEVQKVTASLRDLMEQQLATLRSEMFGMVKEQRQLLNASQSEMEGKINVVIAVAQEQLRGVQTQFILLKQATEQLDIANKTAIAAALQAQKESAGETQKTSQAAIAKSENSTSEAIKALTTTMNAANAATNDRINDLKGRLDRGEGKTSVTDPAIGAALTELSLGIKLLNGRDMPHSPKPNNDTWGYVLGAAILVVGIVIALAMVLSKHT